jgi:hypothetical protein
MVRKIAKNCLDHLGLGNEDWDNESVIIFLLVAYRQKATQSLMKTDPNLVSIDTTMFRTVFESPKKKSITNLFKLSIIRILFHRFMAENPNALLKEFDLNIKGFDSKKAWKKITKQLLLITGYQA